MSKTNTGGPAFPFEYHNQTSKHQPGFFGTGDIAPGASQQFAGMTLRDYFAAKAMQALIRSAPNNTTFGAGSQATNSTYAVASYAVADAMLKAREA